VLKGSAIDYSSNPMNPSPVTYHFEYGPTAGQPSDDEGGVAPKYASSTPEKTAGAGGNVSESVQGLTSGTSYHFRVVAKNSAGETDFGSEYFFKTTGARPLPPGATRTTDTVGPGESVSTGSNPSAAHPIVVKVTSEKGGTLYIDEIPDPDRPGEDPDAEVNPEDEGSKTKLWYGPAIRITHPPYASGGNATFVFRIHSGSDLQGGEPWRNFKNPVLTGPEGRSCDYESKVRYLANDDTELTVIPVCSNPTFNFYNSPWGWSAGCCVYVDYGQNIALDEILDRGYIRASIECHQKCARTGTATIAKKTAKKLHLKSTTIGTGHTDLDATMRNKDQYKGLSFEIKLTDKARKALRRASRITVNFELKAVGTKGQVLKKTIKQTYEISPESRGDDIHRR
jgi:hypothetical protein